MRCVVSAAPMYEDGTTGDRVECEAFLPGSRPTAADLGEWLGRQAAQIGTTTDGVRCDAIDVTISRPVTR